MADLVTTDDVKKQLNKTSTADDAELALYISAASEVVENLCGPCSPQPFTETVPGGPILVLSHRPIVSLQSVTATTPGITSPVAVGALVVDADAGLASTPTGSEYLGNQVVTYTAGRASVPASLKLATLMIVGHLWDTQRAASGSARRAGDDDVSMVMGYAIPNRALELMRGFQLPDGFA